MTASITAGAIFGYAYLIIGVLLGVVWAVPLAINREWASALGGLAAVVIIAATFWWGMAFTTSADYHAWNAKTGEVEQVSKRLIATDSGMSERYVLKIDGQPFGVDDSRASLAKEGDKVSLLCKKDYQWGVPREAHGWACRWNGVAS